MHAPPDARTAIWLEYAWAVVTGNAATAALLAGTPTGDAATDDVPDPSDELDLDAELEELADEAAGELPATAGWFGPAWQPGGALCLEEAEDAAGALSPEAWAALADDTSTWRHAGRSLDTDDRWRTATDRTYRSALAEGTWDPGWLRRFWDLAGITVDGTVLAVVGHGREGVLDAAALAGALRPNLILTTSERIGDGVREAVHEAMGDVPVIVVDAAAGTTTEGRTLTFNEWALAASTLLR